MKTFQIESLAFGGDGIGKIEGKVVFVPYTAPGDLVSVSITSECKSFARAKLQRVDEPSILRQNPRCPHFTVCGGCQLQHLDYSFQLKVKAEWLKSSFERVAKLEKDALEALCFEIEPCEKVSFYRSHLTFHLKAQNGGSIAFMAGDNKTAVILQECHLFDFPNDLSLEKLQLFASNLNLSSDGRFRIMKNGKNECLAVLHFDALPKNSVQAIKALMQTAPCLKGVLMQAKQKRIEIGSLYLDESFMGLSLKVSPSAFLQNNKGQTEKLYHQLIDRVLALGPSYVWDLYSGIGITSLLLAKNGIRVKGVEWNKQAVRLANKNLESNALTSAHFIAADVDSQLKKNDEAPDVVIVNPPRVGMASGTILKLIEMGPKDIFYISCMPATLARDLKIFMDAGYKLKFVKGFDMFPMTTHMETLVHLSLF